MMFATLLCDLLVASGLVIGATLPTFEQVSLEEPLDWIAGGRLFPGYVIAGYNTPFSSVNATDWADKILGICESIPTCTSSLTYAGNKYRPISPMASSSTC